MFAMILVIISFLLAIILNWKYKINMGIVAGGAAFLIGCFCLGISPGELKNMIPIKVIFPVVSITFFYGFAVENGSINLAIHKLLNSVYEKSKIIPAVIMCMTVSMGLIGMDAGSIIAMIAPIALTATATMGVDSQIIAYAILFGAPIGSNYVFSNGGSIMRGIIEEWDTYDNAISYINSSFIDAFVFFVAFFFIISTLHFKKKPQSRLRNLGYYSFTKKQIINLILIGMVVLITSVNAIISATTKTPRIASFCKNFDIGYIALLGSVAASIMKLGDTEKIIRERIPWKTLIMISGISMLIGVAKSSGLIDLLGGIVSSTKTVFFLPALLVLISGCMSIFSSAISVVVPTLFPLVPVLALNTNYKISMLYSCIVLGACITGASPFSTGGALVVGCVTDNTMRDKMMFNQLLVSLVGIILGAVFMELRCHLWI